ncbi:MAG TPA: GNAT family N-acetyltransferase [Kiritimatiellia bacterium]|nr:GNAT family N-acetyltransferase [Kiritimatiellia bacterium]
MTTLTAQTSPWSGIRLPTERCVYRADEDVDPATDRALRRLLSAAFCRPEHARFRAQRYFYEPYPHRWLIHAPDGRLAAHAGVHDRMLHAAGRAWACAGLADVCVHPDYRGRGLMRWLFSEIHGWLRNRGVPFALLFGDPAIYHSSGYRPVRIHLEHPPADLPQPLDALAASLNGLAWPAEPPTLSGGLF